MSATTKSSLIKIKNILKKYGYEIVKEKEVDNKVWVIAEKTEISPIEKTVIVRHEIYVQIRDNIIEHITAEYYDFFNQITIKIDLEYGEALIMMEQPISVHDVLKTKFSKPLKTAIKFEQFEDFVAGFTQPATKEGVLKKYDFVKGIISEIIKLS